MLWKIKEKNTDMRLSWTPQPFLNALIRRPYSFIDRNTRQKRLSTPSSRALGDKINGDRKIEITGARNPEMYVKTKRHPIGFIVKSWASDTGEFVRKLKQWRRRRQESNRFRLAKQQLSTKRGFLVHFYTVDARLRRVRRRQQAISYSFLSVAWISSFRTQLHKNLPKLKNSTMNKSYEV